jgi:purine-binding chemotaxis protein CheW
MHERGAPSLLCRVGNLLCVLPLEHVEETMRPLTVEPLAGVPAFVQGFAVVRGVPIPVVNAGSLLGGTASHPARFVTVKTGRRRIALAVDAVVGINEIPLASLDELPLFLQIASLDAISAIGVIDAELLLVLRSTRLISEEVWATIQAGTLLNDPDARLR